MKTEYSIRSLRLNLEVSPSGYYGWRKRRFRPSPRTVENQALAQETQAIHAQSRQTYGRVRIRVELKKKGRLHGRNRIARIMQEKGLRGCQRRRYRVQTTDSNPLWVAAITYIETQEGWLHRAAILDLSSRKIIGWAMSERLDTSLALKALSMALRHRRPPADLPFHPDRGVQYASADYRRALDQAGLVASMSRKGNCYDNATMESSWSTLKLELVYRRKFATRDQARGQIFEYIEIFCNRQRAHSALDHHFPVDLELQNN